MNLAPEHRKDFEAMPAVLRRLLEAELAAGNSIVEVGHSFPAPPVGAYFQLANKVTTRPRESGNGIDFYERNSSSYSGEFTDAKRFFFILEPPNPPPPCPDMAAIRKAHDPKPDSLTQLSQRPTGSSAEIALNQSYSFSSSSENTRDRGRGRLEQTNQSDRPLTSIETATGSKWVLHFQDKRPPQEIQAALERQLMTLFVAAMDQGQLRMLTQANVVGARYFFELRFEAALPKVNYYSLRIEVSWADQSPKHHDYYRKTSDSWFELWTRDLMRATQPRANDGSPERYHKLSDAALKAEAHLTTVPSLQEAIVAAMKNGAHFATAHKEGGTHIRWLDNRFVSADYGESEERREFLDEAEFLKFLRQFFSSDISRNASRKLSEPDAWKLIYRLLRRG